MGAGLVDQDRRVLSPLAPGHRPGVSPPWLDRYQFWVALNLPCDVRPRRAYMVTRQRADVVARRPLQSLRVLARTRTSVRVPATRTASTIAGTSYFRIVRKRRKVCQVT